MPGFYYKNGNETSQKTNNQSNGKKKKGFYHVSNKDTKNTIEYGGVTLGTVTNKGLKAIENNTLDSYVPETEEEKRTIQLYKEQKNKNEHYNSQTASDKIRNQKVRTEVGKPVNTFELFSPTPKPTTTVKTSFGDVEVNLAPSITKTAQFIDEKNKKEEKEREEYEKKHPIKANAKKVIADIGYTIESVGAGAIGGVESIGQFLTSGAHSLLGDIIRTGELALDVINPFDHSSASNKMLDTAEMIEDEGKKILENKYIGETWKENADKRYADSTHDVAKTISNTAYSAGTLIPAIATEIFTASASPMGDIWVAKNLLNFGKVAKASSKVTKYISPSEIMFGLSASGSSASQATREGADLDSALLYGAMNGLGEVATERIFGGIAGTKLGKSIIAYKPSSKILDTAFDLGGEAIEESLMAFADPYFKRATYDADAELATWKDYTESAKQGILLSLFMKTATFPFTVKSSRERAEAVNTVNSVVDGINQIIIDSDKKLTPLSKNASIEDIQEKQKEIKKYAELYAKQLNAEVSKNLTENADTINAKYQDVEDTLKAEVKDTYNNVVEVLKGKNDTSSAVEQTTTAEESQENIGAPIETIDTTTPVSTAETTPTNEVVTPTEVAQETPVTAQPTTKGVTSAYTNDNQKIDLRYKVVSADDLIVSNNADGSVNPNYPQELQPRDRERGASILQVQNIANNVVPEKLGESTNVSDGAPIVSNDNVVESGNGRTMALSLMYKTNPEGAKKYVEFITANADKFGIDVSNLPKNPVLVRERLTEVDRVEFVKKANESNLSSMNATELAKSDSERLTSDILKLLVANDDGNINTVENEPFISRVISNVFSQNDLNSVVGANNKLSANGLERIRNALFYKAYGDEKLASRLSESLDNDIKNITNVLVNIAPKVVAIKNGIANGDYYDNLDFSQDIVDGINFLQNAKKAGLSVENFSNQLTIGDNTSDVSKAIAYIFEQKNRGAKQATLLFNHLFDIIMEKDPNQLSFLSDTKVPTKERVLDEAIDKYNNDEQRTGETVSISERIIPQGREESARENDTGGIIDNVESASEPTPVGSESDRAGEQQGYVKEATVVGGNESTSRPSENGTADSRTENITDEAEVGAGELSYDDFTLDKSKNTKTGEEIWVIRPKERVENFTELREKMKSLGGYYSRFAETPHGKGGFVFKENPSHLFVETQEVTNNVRGKEVSDTDNTESTRGEVVSREERSNSERISRRIEEILLETSVDRAKNGNNRNRTGRVEHKETSVDFEYRVRDEGYVYRVIGSTSVAFKQSPESKWNKNAKEVVKTLESLGFNVIVFEGDFLSNTKDVTENLSEAITARSGDIFVSDNLSVDAMETAYHEAFHALKHIDTGEGHRNKIVNIISNGVNVESEAFKNFVSDIAELYSYDIKEITHNGFLEQITEEFYAWYIGKNYASKNEYSVDMLSYIKEFSDVDNIKPQLDALFAEVKSNAVAETPTESTQDKPILNETKLDEQTPTEAESVKIEQNTSKIEEQTTSTATTKNDGTKQIADYVADKLSKGEKITAIELSVISTKAFGGTMADNVYTVKDAYDAMELGVNKYILSMEDVSAQKMLELLELLPTQTKRTEEMIKFQQFSTPPSIAYLANYVANVNSDDIMLEPSAGIGGIAVFAKKDGATVYVNELDTRRLEVLRNMPFDRFFNENAEQLDNILGGKIEPTVIVMNPPFSSSSERNIHNTKIGAKHIEEALKILAPNGRLVAIVGHGMGDGAPAFRDWWKDIKSKYNVRANIRINGKNYNKYGTNFDIQMLVIDKNGATTHTETGYVDTLQELQDKLRGIKDERPIIDYKGTEQKPSELTRKETSRKGKTSNVGNKSVSGTDNVSIDGKQTADTTRTTRKSNAEVLQSTDTDSGRTDNQAPENTDVVANEQSVDGRGELGGHTELQDDGGTDVSVGEQHSEQSTVDRSERNSGNGQNNVGVQRRKRTELTDSIFEQYQTQPLQLKNTKPHPARVSESAAMSAITPPVVTYKPNISQDIIEKGVVSDVQLEAISYAGQSHSQVLPNGTTRGFFLGDGTGIGKGRTIAGMMLDNYNQGRKKSLWVTLNPSLVNDAKRDVKALFGDSDLVVQFEGGGKADKIFEKDEAILVVSYTTLSRGYDKKGSNFEKIIEWLGNDFDGLIVFDEAHKMGNATGKKGARGGTKPSQTGLAGIALQEALPKSRVVYSSATGATEVENLRYAERLGLWGEGTPFVTGNEFVSKIKAGGLASMELIARDMKAMGVYLSRNISYDDVQYDKITHKLTSQQIKIYDELARSWQIVLQNINKALENTNQDKDGHARGRALGAFWSSQQRFFNQILTSMQVPSVISDIEKQLADGKSCVIQLVSTNESAQNQEFERLKSEDLELDEFDLTPKQVLMAMIENSFPVQQFEEYRDDEGKVRSKPVYDSMGNPVLNREAIRQRDELLDKLGSIKVPSSPLDMIINHFGTDLVAENTGRARRVIQRNGKTIEEKIGSKKDADVDAFQNGDKRIIIFSKAGGTGKSYHADKSAKNQQQRVHYLLEAGWQADNAVQGFGRSHRSNQASAPIFKLVTTNLKGQMRFISTIAKRLDQLGAMTKGQRQAGGQGMFSASDNLENSFASDVLAVFYKDLLANRVDGIDNGLSIIEKLGLKDKILDEYSRIIPTAPELREVNKFLNRILSLESTEQNIVFEGYSQRLQEATEKAMADGTLDKGLENYKADKITLNEVKDIREDERSGAKTKYYNLTAEHKIKPIKFEDINTESKSFVGFYQNKNTGAVRAVMKTSSVTDQYGNVTDNYKLVGQAKNEYIAQYRLHGNWTKIDSAKAETLWNEELTKLPEYRKENLHLISGVVLPIWDKLPTENVRIYRVLTSDGEMLIGRVVAENMIDETLRRLGSSRTKEKIATKDLIEGIKNGDTVYLENGWKIVQRKVTGENRIELVGTSYEYSDLLKEKGVFTERIQYTTRYFVPTNTNTEKIIDEILKISPVLNVESANDVSYDQASVGDRWKTNNAESNNKKQQDVSLNSIVKKIRNKFGIPISTGKVSRKDARGVYKRKAEVIRTRIANNLPTISHELGHHLDKLYSFSKMESVKKLIKALPQDFLLQYPAKERGREAVAEFVRTYLKSKTEAQSLNAEFYNDFVNTLSKEDLNAINEIASDFNHYLTMDFEEKVKSAIVDSKRSFKDKVNEIRTEGISGVVENTKDKASDEYTKWIDSFHPIKQAVDFVEKAIGKTLDGVHNAYILATNSLNSATITSYLVNDGFRDLNGNILEEMSFKECIQGVKAKDLNTLSEYLVLKHSLELINQDVRVFADDTLEDVDTIKKSIERIERNYPEMIEASENLYEYQRNMLKYYLVDSGLLSQAGFDAMVEKYPCYVPFYRDVSKRQGQAKGTFANQTTPIKRIKGSGASIINPLESIVKNTEKFVKSATRNQVMQVLTGYANEADGFGQFLEKVNPDMMPHVTDITRYKEKFVENLRNVVGAVDYFNVTNLLDELINDTVMDFTPKANASKKLVTVMENGHASYYQIHDEALYKAIAEMSVPQLEGILKTVSDVMLPMKMLMTQINPLFASSNFFRDVGTAYKHSQINNPIEFTVRYISALKSILSNNETYQQYKAMGGGHSSKLASEIDQIKRMLHDLEAKDKGKARQLAYSLFRHPLETVTSINDIVESIPRVMEFARTLEESGDLQQAIHSADDITTNFKRHGSGATAKFVNNMVFFNNASLQGLDKTRRSLTGNDAKSKWVKWALFALLSSALQYFWNRYNDEEGYENLSSYTKNNFYNYSVGDGKFVAIPKPREVALLDSITERTIEYAFGNKDAFYEFGGYLAQNLLPPMLPETTLDIEKATHDVLGNTVLGGITDIGFNQDFLGRPIESNYEQNYLESWERWDEGTSKVAYRIGQSEWARNNDVSPKKIDHLLSSYLGIIGSGIQAVFPMDETRKDVTLGLRNRFIKDSVYSTDVINKLWENTEKAEAQFKHNNSIENAIEYEQNAIITNYVSEMLNSIYALPLEEQRDARKYLLKELNGWDYNLTISQQQMKTSLVSRMVEDKILIELPNSTYEWTENKQKYSYQMTPEEYSKFAKNYLKEVEKYRVWCKKTYTNQDDYVDKLSDYNGAVMKYMRPYYNKQFKPKATKK